MFLPVEFENRMKRILGAEFENYLKSFNETIPRAFHINNKKISREKFLNTVPFSVFNCDGREDCFIFECESIGKHPFHHAGMIYVQEPAAMFPVEGVNIKPDWNILDMCAAPGGKSSQTMQKLGENGHLVSNEIIPSRCKMLTGNFERLGYRNSNTLCAAPKDVADAYGRAFDFVICDAPCSGEGMFRKEPEAVNEWSIENVEKCSFRQKEVLSAAVRCVKSGGYLLYSTCTFSEDENEEIVLWLLKNYPEFELVGLKEQVNAFTAPGCNSDGKTASLMRRFYPHIATGEGQFAALLRYNGKDDIEAINHGSILRKPTKDEYIIADSFLRSVLPEYDKDRLAVNKDKLIYADPEFFVPMKFSYMSGVTVGTLKKDRLEPHHQFFSAFGNEMLTKVDFTLDDDKLYRYLRGESFEIIGEKGWYSIQVNGCAIGGGRLVNGYMKNLYPRGLQNI